MIYSIPMRCSCYNIGANIYGPAVLEHPGPCHERGTFMDLQHSTKPCTMCKAIRPLDAFSPDRRARDGRQSRCKQCQANVIRDRYKADPEAARARLQADRKANPERWHGYDRKYNAADPQKHRNETARYTEANKQKVAERQLQYRRDHPEKHLKHENDRRARKIGNGGTYTLRDIRRLMHRYRGMCAYCHEAKATTLDHVLAISRGGRNTIGNLLPACKSCNYSKGPKLLAVWRYHTGKAILSELMVTAEPSRKLVSHTGARR